MGVGLWMENMSSNLLTLRVRGKEGVGIITKYHITHHRDISGTCCGVIIPCYLSRKSSNQILQLSDGFSQEFFACCESRGMRV